MTNSTQEEKIIFNKIDFEPISDYDPAHVVSFMKAYNESKIALFIEKDRAYGGSWMKDGSVGAFMNLKRKMDRVITQFKNGRLFSFLKDSTGETSVDTYMDLENYSSLNLFSVFIKIKDKQAFINFLEKVPEIQNHFFFEDSTKSVKHIGQ